MLFPFLLNFIQILVHVKDLKSSKGQSLHQQTLPQKTLLLKLKHLHYLCQTASLACKN